VKGCRPGGAGGGPYACTTDALDADGDLDFVAINRVLAGARLDLTVDEKIYVARILDSAGLSMRVIGPRVRTDPYTVSRWKENGWKRLGPGAVPRVREERPEPRCGEARMYRRHLKRGERCDVCRAANAAADRRYRLTGTRRVSG